MILGAGLVEKTVGRIVSGNLAVIDQQSLVEEGTELKKAPKIFTVDCRINWNRKADQVFNFIRGLSPHPGAWSEWQRPDGDILFLKIFSARMEKIQPAHAPGSIITDYKNQLEIAVPDGYLSISSLQQAGRKRMDVAAFLRGIKGLENYTPVSPAGKD
jgi:methionyl-tRNA formyltransferase